LGVVLSCGARSENGGNGGPVRDSFVEPPVWSSHGGVLSGTLVVGRARNRLGGRVIDTLTYNGGIPGPTWSVRPGDEIRVRLINRANLSQTAEVLPQIC